MIGDSNDETNFTHELLLTDRLKVSRLCKAFVINLIFNIKLMKTQLSKMVQSRTFLGPASDLALLLNPEEEKKSSTKIAK